VHFSHFTNAKENKSKQKALQVLISKECLFGQTGRKQAISVSISKVKAFQVAAVK